MSESSIQQVVNGAIAGAVATAPMSVVMLIEVGGWRSGDLYPLPPRQITLEAAEAVGARYELTETTRSSLTVVNHFAYGAAMGGVFGGLCHNNRSGMIFKGIGFGVAVWAGSYLGWLPAAHSRAAAHHQSGWRNATMIAAHVVWGASLGYLMRRKLKKRRMDRHADARPRHRV